MVRTTVTHWSETGDWLDVLPKVNVRSPPELPAPTLPATFTSPILLVGLVSGTKIRRDVLRCTWVRALVATGGARVKFVVGENAPDAKQSGI